MYSQTELQSAVDAGAISAEAADAFRNHVAKLRALPSADEENVRLVSGFNDIFVTIACALVIVSALNVKVAAAPWLGALLVAIGSWLMAELFTRKRRMALPSLVLLGAFVLGAGACAWLATGQLIPLHSKVHSWEFQGQVNHWTQTFHTPFEEAIMMAAGACVAAIGAVGHWIRFRVAMTIAAGVGSIVALLLASLAAMTGQALDANPFLAPAALVCGLAVFALAMRWDLSDPARRTQRADIAFWLHLLAAPLLAHPLFYWMGVLGEKQISTAGGLGVLAIYLGFALVALAIDRRALLVSALAYVLIALFTLLKHFGAVGMTTALTTLLIGSALLGLSAFWAPLRRRVLHLVPTRWADSLPAAA